MEYNGDVLCSEFKINIDMNIGDLKPKRNKKDKYF